MITHNIVNSQPSLSCMNMTDVIIKETKYQKEIQKLSKNLQMITHPPTLQSGIKIPTHNLNSLTTDHPVNSMLTMTNLNLPSRLYTAYWPKSPQWEDPDCSCARIANPHPAQQQLSSHIELRV